MRTNTIAGILILCLAVSTAFAAPRNRIQGKIDGRLTQTIRGGVHSLAQPQFDQGAVEPGMNLDHVQLVFLPSPEQQADLDQFLLDQQNPSSPSYHQWLTPEQYADRFGLSAGDHSKIVSWLTAEGLTVQDTSRGRNFIAFGGNAGKVSTAFKTSIHRYKVNGETHFANATAPSVPAAIAGLVGGFLGMNDFNPKSTVHFAEVGDPSFTSVGSHYLAPSDFATIYNLAPLYAAGIDGTGQSIAVVGASDIVISDIRAFRSIFGLPASDPKIIQYGANPGINGAQFESNLDIEWSGAVAPKAAITYVFGANAFTAWTYAVNQNVAPIISISFGYCETDDAPYFLRTIAQQANAQGITILNSSGDSGAGSCNSQGGIPLSTHGKLPAFPANMPEVTGVGGTMFNEGTGNYWAARNDKSNGSALSYIPEAVWNESSFASGLLAGGGGASRFFPKPTWQTGPGVPADGARDVPDISLSAALHDGYLVTYNSTSNLYVSGGTSASSPSMAGILALLNQYTVSKGFQKTPGLGNINPQLYRLAQTTPAAFHDVTSGDNIVPCAQGSADCLTGSYGYAAGPGYDLASGLGSVDANVFVTSWNSPASPVSVMVTSNTAKATVNDMVTLTANVSAAQGTPTGTVSFAKQGGGTSTGTPLGSASLSAAGGAQTASITVAAWMLGTGTDTVIASYSGDGAFSAGAASVKVQVTLPTTPDTSAIVPSVTNPVYQLKQFDSEPPTWQATVVLTETAGVAAAITGFTIDGVAQPLATTFPSTNIPPKGSITTTVLFRNLTVPASKVLGFTGTDVSGQTWTRQVTVQFLGQHVEVTYGFDAQGTPLVVQQNPAAPPSCQWQQQVHFDETSGNPMQMVLLYQGSVNISSQIPAIFGTSRMAPLGSMTGTLCWTNPVIPSTDVVFAEFSVNGVLTSDVIHIGFTGPAPTPVQLSVSPASVTLKPPTIPNFTPVSTFAVNLSDKTQQWTATVFPANRTTSWLQLSQSAGTGPATISVQANPAGFEPGAYKATIVIQSPNSTPQFVSIPVMWVNGALGGPQITSVGNALSFVPGTAAPGSLMAVYGSGLANTTQSALTLPLDISMAGVSATVNGWPAPLLYASPTQLNLQVPFEAGAGPAVLSVNNNGQVGGYLFQVAPSAPGILSDGKGGILGAVSVKPGGYASLYFTGAGDVTTALPTGIPVPTGTRSGFPTPYLPVNVTVGGTPALTQFLGVTPGVIGLTQINFVVPPGTAAGSQPVTVTVNGVTSLPANLTVVAP